jgi:hypothetical protein
VMSVDTSASRRNVRFSGGTLPFHPRREPHNAQCRALGAHMMPYHRPLKQPVRRLRLLPTIR